VAMTHEQRKEKRKEWDTRYREKHLEDVRKRSRGWAAKERKENPEAAREAWGKSNAKRYRDNKEKVVLANKASAEKRRARDPEGYREARRLRQHNLRKTSLNYRISQNLRSRLYSALRGYERGKVSAVRHLGCTVPELRARIEAMFEPGMRWDNYGEWHIDHVLPFGGFDLTVESNVEMLCHYSNLQPLWAEENLKKGAKK